MKLDVGLYGGFLEWGLPQNGLLIIEDPIKMDDLGVTPILGNLHMGLSNVVHGYLMKSIKIIKDGCNEEEEGEEQDEDDAEATAVTIMVVVTVNDADDAPYVYYV